MAGDRARPALRRHARATDRPRRSPPMPATAAPTPGQATTAFHPARQRTASGEKATRPPATRWRSCLLHTDGTTRPAPTAAGRRRAGCVRHHGGTPTPNDGGGPLRRAGHGGDGPPVRRTSSPARRTGSPPPPPPTHRPAPHPGRPSTRPSQDRGRRARRHRRRCHPPGRAQHGPGVNRPPPPTPTPFSVCPADWDKRCGWFSPQPPVFNPRGARAQARGPIPSTDRKGPLRSAGMQRTARFDWPWGPVLIWQS